MVVSVKETDKLIALKSIRNARIRSNNSFGVGLPNQIDIGFKTGIVIPVISISGKVIEVI